MEKLSSFFRAVDSKIRAKFAGGRSPEPDVSDERRCVALIALCCLAAGRRIVWTYVTGTPGRMCSMNSSPAARECRVGWRLYRGTTGSLGSRRLLGCILLFAVFAGAWMANYD